MAKDEQSGWGFALGSGLLVIVGVGLGLWIGSWLDRRFGWQNGKIIGALVGLAAGLYMLIKEAIRANKD